MSHRFSEFYPDIGHYKDGDTEFYEVLYAVGFDTFDEAYEFERLLRESDTFNKEIERLAKKASNNEEEGTKK